MGNPLGTGLAIALFVIGLTSGALAADDDAEGVDPSSIDATSSAPIPDTPLVELHGFISQGFIKSTDNDYLGRSKRGSFEFSEAALNITRALSPDMRVGMQLFTRDLGEIGDYRARFDWFYLDYRFFDSLGVRFGRTKLPFGLYNENADIDAARVPILLPQSVYPTANRDALLAQTGVEVYGLWELGVGHELEYRLYGGTIYLDLDDSTTARFTELEVAYLAGGRLMWLTPIGLQFGGSAQLLRFEGEYTPSGPEDPVLRALIARNLVPPTHVGPVDFEQPALLWVASAEYTAGDLVLAAEYSRWWSDADFRTAEVRSSLASVTSERAYGMGHYRVAPWFTPGLYYSVTYPDTKNRRGQAQYQHDFALFTRFDINQHWIMKAEAHYMLGTATLSAELNGMPLTELAKDWGVLLLKTTAYF